MKRAELLSTLGAGVLGFGIALLLPNLLAGYAFPVLVIGILAHVVGMYQMRSLEQEANRPRAAWMDALYWFCWLILAALFVYLGVRAIGWA
jgi:polyferredoxin